MRQKQCGHTLVEWLLAAALTAMMLMALLSVFPALVGLQHIALERSTAMCLAWEAVEKLRATPPSTLFIGRDVTEPVGVDSVNYSVDVTVNQVTQNLLSVDVIVSWTHTISHHVNLHTEIFRQIP